jgi:hypothetical protein
LHENSHCFDSRDGPSQSAASDWAHLIAEGHEVDGLSGNALRERIEGVGAKDDSISFANKS